MANDGERLLISFEARLNKYEKDIARARRGTDREMGAMQARALRTSTAIQTSFSSMGRIFMGAAGGFATGALAALAPMALFSKALETINDASHIVDTADKIGITTTALQELSFGFSQAGVDVNTFETGMEQFSKRIGEAATRGSALADILEANGVAIRDANGQIKTSEQLLPAYAELIRNATSEQEKMLLVTEAFGRGGGDMLNGLNQGAEGINNMKTAAQEAGGVIDEELLRRAEEFGDRWDAAWRRFTVNSQSAILSAIDGMARLNSALLDFEKQKAAASAGDLAGSLVGKLGDVLTPGTRDKPSAADAGLSSRMGGALTTALDAADQKLVDALQARYGAAATKATVIPAGVDTDKPSKAGGSGRNAAADAALREAEAVLTLIDTLEFERSTIGMTDVERETANALRRAGAGATDDQRAKIEQLIEAIYREGEANDATAESAKELRGIGKDVLGGIIADFHAGASEAKILANAIDKIADKLINLALDGLFDGGGFLGKIFGFAGGGVVKAATGGRIAGPGSGTSDSIPAMLSDGEHVINARSAGKHRSLLEAINADRVPALRDGGAVGGTGMAGRISGGSLTVSPTINVNVEAGAGGTPGDRSDLADKMAAQIEARMRGVVADEIQRARRPGNVMNSRG